MPTGAAIGAAGIGSAVIGSSAAKSASKAQVSAADRATAVQQQMYGQTREDLQPFREYGAGATSALAKLLGFTDPGNAPKEGDPNIDAWIAANPDVAKYYANSPQAQEYGSLQDFARNIAKEQAAIRSPVPTYTAADVANFRSPQEQALENLPGYKFARDQGIQSVNRTLGTMGQTGAQLKGIARFVTGLADQTYNGQVKNLSDAVSIGENAAAQTGSIGSNYSSSIGNNITGAGAASAAGTVGAANAISSQLGQIPGYTLANKVLGIYGGNSPQGWATYGQSSGAGGAGDVVGLY